MWVSCGMSQEKGKAAEGRVVTAGDVKNGPPGSRDTAAPDICGQETGNSGVLGVPKDYFQRLCKRCGLLGREDTPGSVVDADVSRETSEVCRRRDFGSSKGASVTGIRQVWREQGRVRGGEHRQRRVRVRQGPLVF